MSWRRRRSRIPGARRAGTPPPEGTLRPGVFAAAKRAFDLDWPRYLAVDVTGALCRDAGDLAERHRLKGYDSVHLAAFLAVVRAAGAAQVTFSCFDQHLNAAARSAVSRRRRNVVMTKSPAGGPSRSRVWA